MESPCEKDFLIVQVFITHKQRHVPSRRAPGTKQDKQA